MHRWLVLLRLLACAALLGLTPLAARSQEATPAAGGDLVRLSLAELAPDRTATIGLARTVLEPGGSLRLVAGSGPAVVFVAAGAVHAQPALGPEPLMVAGGEAAPVTPAAIPEVGDAVAMGSAIVVPAGGAADLRNDGDQPATIVDLLAAADATREAATGATALATSQRSVTLPEAPVDIVLGLAEIPPGGQLDLPPGPGETVVAAVDPRQIILVTGRNFNRSSTPVPVYVLTIVPAGAAAGTPAP